MAETFGQLCLFQRACEEDAVVCVAKLQLPTHIAKNLCSRQDSKEHFWLSFFSLCSDFTIIIEGGDFCFALCVSGMQKKQVAKTVSEETGSIPSLDFQPKE